MGNEPTAGAATKDDRADRRVAPRVDQLREFLRGFGAEVVYRSIGVGGERDAIAYFG
jgi:hypothetical protein